MTGKRKTRAELEAEIGALNGRLVAVRGERDEHLAEAQRLRKSLDDVKERLAFAEAELQRMHGYIQRVQEDDVVREELIPTGDREGEQQLVPKRKPTPFCGAVHVPSDSRSRVAEAEFFAHHGHRPERRRHWVTY